MRSNKEIAAEALRRAAVIRERKKRKRDRLITAALLTAGLALTMALSVFIWAIVPDFPAAETPGIYRSIFDSAVVGGYVLVGVIEFSLGALVMYFCLRRLKREKTNVIMLKQKEK